MNNKYYKTNIELDNQDNLNIYSYWIYSSHNTILPYGQIFKSGKQIENANLCYFNILLNNNITGSLEIDINGYDDKTNEILLGHGPFLNNVTLTDLFNTIKNIYDKKTNDLEPLVLNFDNKKLDKTYHYKTFWNNLNILKDYIYEYNNLNKLENGFKLSNIPIKDLRNKIIIRWNENNKCNYDKPNQKVGHELCEPYNNINGGQLNIDDKFGRWVHLIKSKIKLDKEIKMIRNIGNAIKNNNDNKFNYKMISNTQRNIIRIYPNFIKNLLTSKNYDNFLNYIRNGCQMCAINLQTLDKAWYYNKAIFYNDITNKVNSYKLKPLWLLGLIAHPGLFNIYYNIKYDETKYKSIKLLHDIDIDVSIPFFIFEIIDIKNKKFYISTELEWNLEKLTNIQKNINIIREDKISNLFVDFKKVDVSNNCNFNSIYNNIIEDKFNINYSWHKSNTKNNDIDLYNNNILFINQLFNQKNLIKNNDIVKTLFNDIKLFNIYQDCLAYSLLNQNNKIFNILSQVLDEYIKENNK